MAKTSTGALELGLSEVREQGVRSFADGLGARRPRAVSATSVG